MNLYKGRKHFGRMGKCWLPENIFGKGENVVYQKTFLEKEKMPVCRKHFRKRRKCWLLEKILGKRENTGYQKTFLEKEKMLVTSIFSCTQNVFKRLLDCWVKS